MAHRVLVIDDDPQITSTMQEYLTKSGIEVSVASTYEEGMTQLKTNPDLALVDIMLGGKSGLELIKEAKKDSTIATQYMVLTNSLHSDHLADAMSEGITTFIQKADHDPEEIASMVQKQLESGKKI